MMDMQLAEAAAMMQQHPELNTMENRNMLQRLGRHIAGGGGPPPPGLEVKKEKGDGTTYTLTIQDKDDHGHGLPQPFVVLTSQGSVENYTLEQRAWKAIYNFYPIAVAEFLRITTHSTDFSLEDKIVYLKLMPGAKLPVLPRTYLLSNENEFITLAFDDADVDIGDRQIVKDDFNKYKIQVDGKLTEEELARSLQEWLVMHNMYAPPRQLGNVYNLGEEENSGEEKEEEDYG
jgi:hypothetical protein